jgi:hypothetical protein
MVILIGNINNINGNIEIIQQQIIIQENLQKVLNYLQTQTSNAIQIIEKIQKKRNDLFNQSLQDNLNLMYMIHINLIEESYVKDMQLQFLKIQQTTKQQNNKFDMTLSDKLTHDVNVLKKQLFEESGFQIGLSRIFHKINLLNLTIVGYTQRETQIISQCDQLYESNQQLMQQLQELQQAQELQPIKSIYLMKKYKHKLNK